MSVLTRQQVLVLYLENSALDSKVVGWSSYDGWNPDAHTTGDGDQPPYETGVAALADGWRLLQAAQLVPRTAESLGDSAFLNHEFYFERLLDREAATHG